MATTALPKLTKGILGAFTTQARNPSISGGAPISATPNSLPSKPAPVLPHVVGHSSRFVPPGAKPATSSKSSSSSSYGYDVKSKTPFNPFAMPATVGELNKEAIALASPGYQPLLNQNTLDTSAENEANKQRVAGIGNIYNQYGTQAQTAFNETQQALKDIIGANATGDTQSAGVLNAALNSALGGKSALGSMMGISGAVTPSDVAPYTAASQGAAQGTGAELKALSGGLMSTTGANLGNVGLERTQQSNLEAQRHLTAGQTNQQKRDQIVATIPDLVAKARDQLIKDLQSSQNLEFQQTLAAKQFGLSEKTTSANIANAAATRALNASNASANRANQAESLRQGQERIDLDAKKIAAAQVADKKKLDDARAKARGQQEANAVKFLTGFITPTPQELQKTTSQIPDTAHPGQTITIHSSIFGSAAWNRDVGNALKVMMNTYGLSEDRALQLMSGLTTPVGGPGSMTIGQWADTFKKRQGAAFVKSVHATNPPYGLSKVPQAGTILKG